MKTNLSRIFGCVTFVALVLGAAGARAQGGIPRLISYQGFMLDENQKPLSGQHFVQVDYYDASSAGTLLGTEQFKSVSFTSGVFDLRLGSQFPPTNEFPASFHFDLPIWIQIILDPGSAEDWPFPRQEMLSAPYAMNSERANGLVVSPFPVNGTLWPVPIDATGKIDASVLPAPTAGVTTLNAVGPDAGGGISLLPGNGISIMPNASAHTITISATPPNDVIVTVGTTAQHPAAPVQGTLRFNTTTGKFEGYDGSAWVSLN